MVSPPSISSIQKWRIEAARLAVPDQVVHRQRCSYEPGVLSDRQPATPAALLPEATALNKGKRVYLIQQRTHLVRGVEIFIRYAERNGTRRPWLVQLMARRTTKVAAVALANKTARMVWALMTGGERYREPVIA